MEKRNVTVTLEKAKEWYNSNNESLKEIALQAFNRDELTLSLENITSFKVACEAINLNYNDAIFIVNYTNKISKASAAMFKLNIIRKALNLDQGLHFAKNPENSYIYHPYNPLITENSDYYKSELFSGQMEVIGKVRIEGTLYKVLGGDSFVAIEGGKESKPLKYAELVENLVSQLKGKDVHAVVEIISTIGILLDVKEVAAMMECFKVLMLKKMTKELLNKAERKESTTQDVVAALMLKALMEKD